MPVLSPFAALPEIASRSEQQQSPLRLDGELAMQGRYFWQQAAYPAQTDSTTSISTLLTAYVPWNDERDALVASVFGRWDSQDSERSHVDIRELKYFHVGEGWEVHAGIDKVFWGQAESLHLVDVVNQTDLVEHPDTEDKLGQPMLRLATNGGWGNLDVFVMPYFRERTFAGPEGRLRLPVLINTDDDALYESADEQQHVDYALRWSQLFGDWELALSAFDGTSRDPLMVADPLNPMTHLRPLYPQMTQYGLESLYLSGDWIWKLEAIHREGELFEDYQAAVGGFEYTLYGVSDSAIDVGLLLEYQYDSRGIDASSFNQNDLFLGTRIGFNDMDDSQILAGMMQDLDETSSRVFLVEGQTRLSAAWTMNIDIWLFINQQASDPLWYIRQDDFAQLTFTYHF